MRILAPVGALAGVVMYAAAAVMAARVGSDDMLAGATWGGAALSLALIGAIVAFSSPHNRVGWLLMATGLGETVAGTSGLYGEYGRAVTPLPASDAVAWAGGSLWAFSAAILLVYLPLYFPTGRPPTPRWRWVAWAGATGITLLLSASAYIALVHPEAMSLDVEAVDAAVTAAGGSGVLAVADLGFPVLMAAGVAALLSLVVRFVRSRGEERQQVKLLVFAAVVTIVFVIVTNTFQLPRSLETILTAMALPSMGIATMAAVLRYRLFDIDRLISRTLAYASVTVLLVAIYVAAVTLLTAVTAPVAGDSPLAVAAATLLAAAAFGPARRRIQAAVDRRFNRARYDAQSTVAHYRTAVRDQVDLGVLAAGLVATADQAVQPERALLWLREVR